MPPLVEMLAGLAPAQRTRALTHRLWARDRTDSYERLELLGDSALMVIITQALMELHPDASEGDLAWMRQEVVDQAHCAAVACESGLPEMMVREAPSGVDANTLSGQPRVQAALTEAVIGAAWLGMPRREVDRQVRRAFAQALAEARPGHRDPKTALQEHVQRNGDRAHYRIVEAWGPPHQRTFRAHALTGARVLGEGEGHSKRAAEQQAARAALQKLTEQAPAEAKNSSIAAGESSPTATS